MAYETVHQATALTVVFYSLRQAYMQSLKHAPVRLQLLWLLRNDKDSCDDPWISGGTRGGLGDARAPPNLEKTVYIFFSAPAEYVMSI